VGRQCRALAVPTERMDVRCGCPRGVADVPMAGGEDGVVGGSVRASAATLLLSALAPSGARHLQLLSSAVYQGWKSQRQNNIT